MPGSAELYLEILCGPQNRMDNQLANIFISARAGNRFFISNTLVMPMTHGDLMNEEVIKAVQEGVDFLNEDVGEGGRVSMEIGYRRQERTLDTERAGRKISENVVNHLLSLRINNVDEIDAGYVGDKISLKYWLSEPSSDKPVYATPIYPSRITPAPFTGSGFNPRGATFAQPQITHITKTGILDRSQKTIPSTGIWKDIALIVPTILYYMQVVRHTPNVTGTEQKPEEAGAGRSSPSWIPDWDNNPQPVNIDSKTAKGKIEGGLTGGEGKSEPPSQATSINDKNDKQQPVAGTGERPETTWGPIPKLPSSGGN